MSSPPTPLVSNPCSLPFPRDPKCTFLFSIPYFPATIPHHPSRGLIAASALDPQGQLHAQAWDAYSGQPDRRCSGAGAHVLMAQLSHEASSSLHIQQQQEAEQQQKQKRGEGGGGGGARASFEGLPPRSDAAKAAADTGTAAAPPRAAGGAAASAGSSGSDVTFAPRLRAVERNAGPIRQVEQRTPNTLLLDINLQQLLASVAAIRAAAPRPPLPSPVGSLHRPAGHRATDTSAAALSRASSGASVSAPEGVIPNAHARGMTPTPPASGGGGGPDGRDDATSYSGVTGYNAAGVTGGTFVAGSVQFQDQQQQQHGHQSRHHQNGGRSHLQQDVAHLREAALALTLMHRWGLDPEADAKLAALLRDAGLLGAPAAARTAAAAATDAGWPAGAVAGGSGAVSAPAVSPRLTSAGQQQQSNFGQTSAGHGQDRGMLVATASDLEARLVQVAAARGGDSGGSDGGSSGGFSSVLCQEACVCEEGALVAGLPYRVAWPLLQRLDVETDTAESEGGAERLGALITSNASLLAVRWEAAALVLRSETTKS